jgi:hypothetical protein
MSPEDIKPSSGILEWYKGLELWKRVFAPIIVIAAGGGLAGVTAIRNDPQSAHLPCLRITSPKQHAKVDPHAGVAVEGILCNNDDVWVFDHDDGEDLYFKVNDLPIGITGGKWLQEDRPIGDPGDPVGKSYQIVAIRVPPECSRAIEALRPDKDGTVQFRRLPNVCPDIKSAKVADSVVVVKGG